MRLVAQAQSSKSRREMLSDRAAFYLTIIAVVTGGITLATWLTLSDASFAINRMVAVLVIACPHALGFGNSACRFHLNGESGAKWTSHKTTNGAGGGSQH